MSKKLFECPDCGFIFPTELSRLIEKKVQVYCEKCGAPFLLEGIRFKEQMYDFRSKERIFLNFSEKTKDSLERAIQALNKISFLPILIIGIIAFAFLAEILIYPQFWIKILISQLLLGSFCLSIVLYDFFYISPKIKERKYNEIVLDSFCWGILSCILFGAGIIILIKGILIIFYVILNPNKQYKKLYDFGLDLKNSLNRFSAIGGVVIILLAFYFIIVTEIFDKMFNISDNSELNNFAFIFLIFLIIAILVLIIDYRNKDRLEKQIKFEFSDFVQYIVFGILASVFFAAGIFILLKAILIFFLIFGSPSELSPDSEVPEKDVLSISPLIEEEREISPQLKVLKPPSQLILTQKEQKGIKEELKKIGKIKKELEKKQSPEKEIELKLHESLLPIKDNRDKKIVQRYFTKMFTILSKDIRQQIDELKISKEEKKEILKELAFLTKEEQIKFINVIINLYKEIPPKLISRIRKLPNIKPTHYDKIILQLKYMDFEEQLKFIEFLEKNN
ncbi:MAG: cell envelope integrity protein TolA [Promethearchaeota archaeon]